jgi:hypothetical protein
LIACNIPIHNIPDDVAELTIRTLPDYANRHNLPYGIAHELNDAHFAQLPSLLAHY